MDTWTVWCRPLLRAVLAKGTTVPVAHHCTVCLESASQFLCCRGQCDSALKLDPSIACDQCLCMAAAGTPEEASARRWLQVQGNTVTSIRDLRVGLAERPGGDPEVGRLSTLLASLPVLMSIDLFLCTGTYPTPTAAAVRAFLAGAARAIARCSCLQTLRLYISLHAGLADQVPEGLVRKLASVRTLEEVILDFSVSADRPGQTAITSLSLAHLVAGLAGLPRLRVLRLAVNGAGKYAVLPACVSRMAQLTSLSLHGFHGLRCAPGWARMPALARLKFQDCVFVCDGEAALPDMHALVSLTRLDVKGCPSLCALPTSLWRLSQLCRIVHQPYRWASVSSSELPIGGLPTGGAPCSASLTHLTLAYHNLRAFPQGILVMKRLKHLDLSHSCFEQLPAGVSALTSLEKLHLGRHPTYDSDIGGTLDARALGSLAGFPDLRGLGFTSCRINFDMSIQDAADHPRLEWLQLRTAYPVVGPSSGAFLVFVGRLLQQGRARALRMPDCDVSGIDQEDKFNFQTALQVLGFPLHDDETDGSADESADGDE